MKFENTEVWGFKNALRGMRNPMNSWSKSDSNYCNLDDSYDCWECSVKQNCPINMSAEGYPYVIGKNDMKLAQQLIRAGSEHRKFMRQIFISVDITAPLYWWKEFDTYKVGTVANSTSTMHKLATTPITPECFEIDDMENLDVVFDFYDYESNNLLPMESTTSNTMSYFIGYLEGLRQKYLETKDKKFWKELIRWLPESWLQTRTVTMSYENLLGMVRQRRNHKLSEWAVSFINWTKTLPYSQELIFIDEVEE